MKLNLQETDYDQFLADEVRCVYYYCVCHMAQVCGSWCLQQSGALTPSVIQTGMTGKLVAEFQFLRAQAAEPLGQFLDYIT